MKSNRERERPKFFIWWFTPQMATMARTGPGKARRLELHSSFSHKDGRGPTTQTKLCYFPGTLAGTWIRTGAPKSQLTCRHGTGKGSGLSLCTKTSAPNKLLKTLADKILNSGEENFFFLIPEFLGSLIIIFYYWIYFLSQYVVFNTFLYSIM